MIQQIQQLIDRIIGKKGTLSVSSWWMNKILSDLITYCETQEESFKLSINDVRNKLENLINTATVEFENTDVLLEDCSKEIENLVERTEALEARNLFHVCDVIPEEPQENTIYLIPTVNEADNNVLTEWVFINGAWEQFGEFKTDIDLSNYVTKDALPKPDWDADESHRNGIKNRTHSKVKGSSVASGYLNTSVIMYISLETGKEYDIEIGGSKSGRIRIEDVPAGHTFVHIDHLSRTIEFQKLDVVQLPVTHTLKAVDDSLNGAYYSIYEVVVNQLPEEYIPDTIARKSYVDNLNIPKTIVVEDSMLSTRSYVTNLYNTLIECDYTATVKYRENNKVYDCYLVNKDSNFESIYLMYATIYFDEVVSNKIRIYKNGECGKSKETFTNKHTIKTFSANDGNVLNGHYKGSNREGEVARFNWYSNNPDKNLDCNIEYVCKGGSLEFPNDIFWGDGQLPEFKKYHRYIININNQMGKFVEFYRKIRFTVDGEEFEFYLDATLENFINDGVDPNFEIGGQIENTNKFGVLYKGAKLLSEDNVEVSVSDLLIDGHNYVTQKANSLDDLIGTYNFASSGTSLGSTKPTLSKNGNDIVFTNLLGGGPAVVVTFDETNNTITVPKGWSSTYVGPVDVDLTFQVDFDNHTLTLMNVPITVGGWANISKYILTKE